MGLAPLIVKHIFLLIRNLQDRGMTILLVEQNAKAALGIADRGYVGHDEYGPKYFFVPKS
jgi:branched-chain amino acid transport system ATP-binding protein